MTAGLRQDELDPPRGAAAPAGGSAWPPVRLVGVGVVSVVSAVAVLAALPRVGVLSSVPVLLQLSALRGPLVLGALVLAAALAPVLVRRRARGRSVAVVGLAVAGLVAVAGTHVAVLAARGTAGLTGAEPAAAAAQDGRLVVLAFNTQGDVAAADLAAFVESRHADLVMLPETSAETARATAAHLAERGLSYQVLAETLSGGSNPTTALLVGERVGGTYTVSERGPAASFTAVSPDGPPLTSVHTRAPVDLDPAWWSGSVSWAARSCAERPGAIVAGDFNATLDHAPLDPGGCVDAAVASGAGGVGTWPTVVPRALGTPIDHVLVDPDVWRVVRARVLDGPAGSDHRPLEAVVERR